MNAPFRQVALVARNLDAAVRHWLEKLGVGPWPAYTLAPPRLRDCVYRGESVEFSLRHALGELVSAPKVRIEPDFSYPPE